MPNYAYSSMFYRELPRNGSPPWRPDDKDGHYVFAIGENLTPRCKNLQLFTGFTSSICITSLSDP